MQTEKPSLPKRKQKRAGRRVGHPNEAQRWMQSKWCDGSISLARLYSGRIHHHKSSIAFLIFRIRDASMDML